ncbi:MAG: mechanosensitive ion channel family protein [Calothrix sp. MO_167.B42]|nr:mechanosensitive ion channel family protein [Calothrix sp. MO_167.B42]
MRSRFLVITFSAIAIAQLQACRSTVAVVTNTTAVQNGIFPLPNLQTPSLRIGDRDPSRRIVTGWVYLDGKPLFQVSSTKENLPNRLDTIHDNLSKIQANYLNNHQNTELDVQIKTINDSKEININGKYLVTLSEQDMGVQSFNADSFDREIQDLLEQRLQTARRERQPEVLIRQGVIAVATGIGIIIISWGMCYLWRRSRQNQTQPISIAAQTKEPITTELNHKQDKNTQEIKRRLFQITQAGIWGGGGYFILGLFPYTRWLQIAIPAVAKIPVKLGIVGLLTYVGIRFSYILIDRFTSALINSGNLLTPETSERLQLRASTVSGVTKSIVTIIWMGVGVIVALTTVGIDVIPLLAGASIVGVAISLAAQSLIKDAINGFLIVLEDQYALGDVIAVGDMGGLVENMNLRITQLRDAEGRLITIPNSEIKVVANLSSRWSRADLTIPIAYEEDIDKALEIIKKVAFEMKQDPAWKYLIVDNPEVLGIDHFSDRGLIVRVWVKTQPLKQWLVAREFRRRLKIALDAQGITISVLQQAIRIHDTPLLKDDQTIHQ